MTDTDIASGPAARVAGRHPLAVLRARAGYTHGGFARLVADTHAALGYGHMAARREKVSRWESGRATPEHTAQLAIAHLVSVPDEEVLRRGWPHWLHLATGDAQAIELPWDREHVADAVADAARERPAEPRGYLAVAGPAVTALVRDWQAATDGGLRHPAPRDDHSLDAVRARLDALITFDAEFTAHWLYQAAIAELRSLADVLRESTGQREPLRLAAQGAVLCGRLARQAGDHMAAQRFHLAALRAATAAGDLGFSMAVLGLHAGQYLDVGAPDEALTLVAGALSASRGRMAEPRVTALLYTRIAAARIQAGNDPAAADTECAARAALRREGSAPEILASVDFAWIDLALGSAHLRAGRPDRAVQRFTRLLGRRHHGRPPLQAARYLCDAADALAALGKRTAAAEARARAAHLLGGVAPAYPGAARDLR